MKYIIAALMVTASFTAHGSIFSHQFQCEKDYPKFGDMVKCLNVKIMNDESLNSDPPTRTYMALAKSLAAKVDRKQIHEDEAVLALQEKYNEINAEFQARNKPEENKFKSFVKERLRNAPAVNQQPQVIISNNQPDNCYSPNGPINYFCEAQKGIR